jgi:hypothetical protein
MIFNTKVAQKNAGQKLIDHYLLQELWSELDDASQAAVSGGAIIADPLLGRIQFVAGNEERGSSSIAFVAPKI